MPDNVTRSTSRAGVFAIMAAATLWGTTGTAQALSGYAGSPLGLGTARLAGAGLLLLAFAAARHGRQTLRLVWRPGIRGTVVLGAAGMAAYQVSFFVATQRTGVAVGTLTAIGSAPVAAGVLAALLGVRPGRRWLIATAVALTGLVLLIAPAGDARVRPLGVLAGLVAGVSYAAYTWCSRRLLDAGVPPVPVLAALFVGGTVLVTPVTWRDTAGWFTDPAGLLVVGYLAVVATAVPYLIWIAGMATTTPAVATTATLTEPLTATGLGVLVLHETLGAVGAAGVALLTAGMLLTVAGARAAPARTAPPGDTGVSRRRP